MDVYDLSGDPLVTEENAAQANTLNSRRSASYRVLLSELEDSEVPKIIEAFERKHNKI